MFTTPFFQFIGVYMYEYLHPIYMQKKERKTCWKGRAGPPPPPLPKPVVVEHLHFYWTGEVGKSFFFGFFSYIVPESLSLAIMPSTSSTLPPPRRAGGIGNPYGLQPPPCIDAVVRQRLLLRFLLRFHDVR
jgi:hypothetical protein